jgi:hypothetical protein
MSTVTDEMVEAAWLRECFSVREDGALIWKHRPSAHFRTEKAAKLWNGRYAGKRAGTVTSRGYREVSIASKAMKEHRIVWWLTHGRAPANEIDHINGNRADNRPANLRDVPKSVNLHNCHKKRKSKSGILGVNSRANGKFQAQIRVGKVKFNLGTFDNAEDASFAYCAAKESFCLTLPEKS